MLKDTLLQDMKAALKAGDKPRLSTLRFALSKMRECDGDESVMIVLKQLLKAHQDSFEQFSEAGRNDLADGEKASLGHLQGYLPEALPEAELDLRIDAAIANEAATGPRDMGRVMKVLQAEMGMQCDMKLVSHKVKERLTPASD